MKISKNLLFGAIVTISFFALLEGISRIFIFPGAHTYIERRIIEQNLSQVKAKDEFRVFLFGESTMHGHFLYPYSTIQKWMQLYLKDLLPETEANRIKIFNLARIGYDSKFTTTAFIDTLRYKPDIAAFYIANNDFCLYGNRREYFTRHSPKYILRDIGVELPKHSSFLNAMNRLVVRLRLRESKIADAKSKKFDAWYSEDPEDPEIKTGDLLYINSDKFYMLKNYCEGNIKKAIAKAKRNNVKMVFLESVAKWKGYPPVKSIHGDQLQKDRLAEWNRLFDEAEKLLAEKYYAESLAIYKRCLELDTSYAMTYYGMAECYEGLQDTENANKFYAMANDMDRYPIRAPSTVNKFYESLRSEEKNGVFVVPTQKIFESHSPNGIVGDDLIADQIHPAIDGQALIALSIVNLIYEKDLFCPKSEWRWERLRPVEEMKKDLKLTKDEEVESDLALASYIKRDYAKAAETIKKALVLKPSSVFIKSWLAWTYWKGGIKEKALELYRQLYRDDPAATSKFLKKYPQIAKLLL